MSTKPIHRIFLLVSIVSFFGSTAFGAARIINNAPQPSRENTNVESSSVEAQRQLQAEQLQLKEQEQGYKIVLKQEPNNRVALEGLVEVSLQMQNAKGAIAPLKKLTQLYPNQPKYKTLLGQVEKWVSEGKGDR